MLISFECKQIYRNIKGKESIFLMTWATTAEKIFSWKLNAKMFKIHPALHIMAYVWVWFPSGGYSQVFNVTILQLFVSKWTSTRSSGLVPLILRFQSLEGEDRSLESVSSCIWAWISVTGRYKVEAADTHGGAMAAFRLLTNMGSRQATLAAKKSVDAVENREEVGELQLLETSGRKHDREETRKPQAEIKSNSVHESACIYSLRGK